METIAVIAEFNPFHKGHEYLINECKKALDADYCIAVMSGDFVQRGGPAIINKFERTRMALAGGEDAVFELPVYYATGSAEYFAGGAVSIIDRLGAVDYLCFGSECGDIGSLCKIADILNNETPEYKDALNAALKSGKSYAASRQAAVCAIAGDEADKELFAQILSSPNNILGIEYIRALHKRNSKIKPFTIKRRGEEYHSENLSEYSSATAIRKLLTCSSSLANAAFNDKLHPDTTSDNACNNTSIRENNDFLIALPDYTVEIFKAYSGKFADANLFSDVIFYRLNMLKETGYSDFLDVSDDLSQKISSSLESFRNYDSFCLELKSKDIAYSRISRSLLHILLGITEQNMSEYKNDAFTGYARVLGLRKDSSLLMSALHNRAEIPIIDRLKDADKLLSPLQKRLFDETLSAGRLYNHITQNGISSEYRLKQIVI